MLENFQVEKIIRQIQDKELAKESSILESLADICFDKWVAEKGKQRKAKLVLQESIESAEMSDKSPP